MLVAAPLFRRDVLATLEKVIHVAGQTVRPRHSALRRQGLARFCCRAECRWEALQLCYAPPAPLVQSIGEYAAAGGNAADEAPAGSGDCRRQSNTCGAGEEGGRCCGEAWKSVFDRYILLAPAVCPCACMREKSRRAYLDVRKRCKYAKESGIICCETEC